MKFLIGGKVREPKDASKSIQGRLGVIPRPAVFDWRLLIISLNGRRCKNSAPCVVFLQKIKQNCFIFSFSVPRWVADFLLSRKPPAVLVVPKSFSFAQFVYPSRARNKKKPSPLFGGEGVNGVDGWGVVKTPHHRLKAEPPLKGKPKINHIYGSRANSANDCYFDEPIGSANNVP